MVHKETLNSLERLHQLKVDGAITEAEFEQSKSKLLSGSGPRLPTFVTNAAQGEPNELLEWIKLPLKRYADFNGRSRRKEFWLFQLLYVPITLAVILFAGIGLFDLATLILAVSVLGLFIPQLALQVRRFHDQDKSGWFALFNIIPYIGIFITLIFMCIEGTKGENRFGPDPKE